ncbi:MAG: hypothetical protein F6K50_53830 [Moorea sp. SIO3I7]|nr:hypothetical protein [Moorena sp. SIO3I7]
MTRWVERASWWNGHLGGMGILPVSFPGKIGRTKGCALRGGLSQPWLRGEK